MRRSGTSGRYPPLQKGNLLIDQTLKTCIMTKYFLIALFALGLFACEEASMTAADIPAPVMTAFKTAYPTATDVEWEKEDDGYEVEFDMNGEEMEIKFDAMGKMIDNDLDD